LPANYRSVLEQDIAYEGLKDGPRPVWAPASVRALLGMAGPHQRRDADFLGIAGATGGRAKPRPIALFTCDVTSRRARRPSVCIGAHLKSIEGHCGRLRGNYRGWGFTDKYLVANARTSAGSAKSRRRLLPPNRRRGAAHIAASPRGTKRPSLTCAVYLARLVFVL
jgi:hypothetical protein